MSPQKHQSSNSSSTGTNYSLPLGENKGTNGKMLHGSAIAVPLDQIELPPYQPRQHFDEEGMQQLTASVKQHGILQPLLIRPVGKERYELVAGERRYRAAKGASLTSVPAVIKELSAKEATELALLENLHREDLNAIEETEGILQLIALTLEYEVQKVPQLLYKLKHHVDKSSRDSTESGQNILPKDENAGAENDNNIWLGMTVELAKVKSVFESLNRMSWESFVKTRLSLLNLPADVLDAVRKNQIKYTKAQAIARVKDDEARGRLLSQAIASGWSLKQIKERIKSQMGEKATQSPSAILTRLDETYKQIKTSMKKNISIWQEPQNQERLEALLTELETLLMNKSEDGNR
ncbi:MAG: ParB/RepB/Spo0J family partition protein [Hormoscilla sp. GM7CHS1pb]|nr:ParB/RepB/Spo0J family partition protein [Hormoscilla sp. GM7CHS1pb]